MTNFLVQLNQMDHWHIDLLAWVLLLQGATIVPIPEEVIITTLGVLWGQHRLNFFEALFSAQAGLLLANAAMVLVGRTFGATLTTKRPFSFFFRGEAIQRALLKLKKNGAVIVFFTRFTPVVRGPIYAAAGISQMSLRKFMSMDALASCVQIPLLLWLGRELGNHMDVALGVYRKVGILVGGLFVVGIALSLVIERRNRLKLPPSIADEGQLKRGID